MNFDYIGKMLSKIRVYWSYFLAFILTVLSIGSAIYGLTPTQQVNCDPKKSNDCKLKTRKYVYLGVSLLLILISLYTIWYDRWRYFVAQSSNDGAKYEVAGDFIGLATIGLGR